MTTTTTRRCDFCPREDAGTEFTHWGTVHTVTLQNQAVVKDICPACIAGKLYNWGAPLIGLTGRRVQAACTPLGGTVVSLA